MRVCKRLSYGTSRRGHRHPNQDDLLHGHLGLLSGEPTCFDVIIEAFESPLSNVSNAQRLRFDTAKIILR